MAVNGKLFKVYGEDKYPNVIELKPPLITFGRGVDNDYIFDHLQVSRRHASLEFNNGRWYIKDNSSNGIMINRERPAKFTLSPLKHHDLIYFVVTGSLQYRFEIYNALDDNIEIIDSEQVMTNKPSTSSYSSYNKNNQNKNEKLEKVFSVSRYEPDSFDFADNNNSCSIIPNKSLCSQSQSQSVLSLNDSSSLNSLNGVEINGGGYESDNSVQEIKKRKHNSKSFVATKKLKSSKEKEDEEEELLSISSENSNDILGLAKIKKDELDFMLPDLDDIDIPIPNVIDEDEGSNSSNGNGTNTQNFKKVVERLKRREEEISILKTEKAVVQMDYDIIKNQLDTLKNDSKSELVCFKEETARKILEMLETEFNCCICNEILIGATVIDCGHSFCAHCIAEWIKKKPECPVCRKPSRIQAKIHELESYINRIHESIMTDEMKTKRNDVLKEREDEIKTLRDNEIAAANARRNGEAARGHRGLVGFGVDELFNEIEGINVNDFISLVMGGGGIRRHRIPAYARQTARRGGNAPRTPRARGRGSRGRPSRGRQAAAATAPDVVQIDDSQIVAEPQLPPPPPPLQATGRSNARSARPARSNRAAAAAATVPDPIPMPLIPAPPSVNFNINFNAPPPDINLPGPSTRRRTRAAMQSLIQEQPASSSSSATSSSTRHSSHFPNNISDTSSSSSSSSSDSDDFLIRIMGALSDFP